MAGRIEKDQVIAPNLYGDTIAQAREMIALHEAMNAVLKEQLNITSSMVKNKVGSYGGIQETLKAYNMANDAAQKYESNVAKIAIAEEKLAQAKIKTARDTEALAAAELRTQAVRDRGAAKAVSNASKEGNAYYRTLNILKELEFEYVNLAAKKEQNMRLSDEESLRYDILGRRIVAFRSSLNRVNESMGRYTHNVGNYASGWNGLQNSINQITRELPNFALRLETGFLAISNNIPMLADQIQLMKIRNQELASQGKETIPVIRQLGAAFFTWQTLLSAGIVLLTIYGADIVRFFQGTSKAQEEFIKKEKERAEQIERTAEQARTSAAREIGQLNVLLQVAQDVTRSYEDRAGAAEQLQQQYPKYFANLSKEQIMAGNIADAYERATQAIYNRIAISIYEEKIVDILTKRFEAQEKLEEVNKRLADLAVKQAALNAAGEGTMGEGSLVIARQINDERKEQARLLQVIGGEYAKQLDLQKKIADLSEFTVKKPGGTGGGKSDIKRTKEEYEEVVDAIPQWKHKITQFFKELRAEEKKHAEWRKELTDILEEDAKKKDETVVESEKKSLMDLIRIYEQFQKERYEKGLRNMDLEIDHVKRRQEELRALAAQGNKDAQDSIVAEQKKQAELERAREKAIQKQKRQEFLIAGLKTYSTKLDGDSPETAVVDTIKDINVLLATMGALAQFYDGTENVAESLGKPHLKGRDGYVVRVDGSERVVPGWLNKRMGDISNENLATIAEMWNRGLVAMPLANQYGNSTEKYVQYLTGELRGIKGAIDGIQTTQITADTVEGIIEIKLKEKGLEQVTTKRIGGRAWQN